MKKYAIILRLICFSIFIIGCTKSNDFTISLDSNPTTGYIWTYQESNNGIVKITNEYKSECSGDIVGCGGKDIFIIKPLKKGQTTITFKYARSFETNGDNLLAIYQINVDDNLNITESHLGTYFEK